MIQRPRLVSSPDGSGRISLHVAAAAGQYQICLLLIRRGARVNQADDKGNTPLHLAAKYKKWAIAEVRDFFPLIHIRKNIQGSSMIGSR